MAAGPRSEPPWSRLAVPEGEREEIAAAAHLIEGMLARLRPADGRNVAAEPAHVIRFPED